MLAILTNGCKTMGIVGICEIPILAESKLYASTRDIIGKIRNVVNVERLMVMHVSSPAQQRGKIAFVG
jgi:hypothetical protein